MINNPEEAIKSQAVYQEDTISSCLLHIEKAINEHLSKYPDEEGIYTISIPMTTPELKDYHYFWEDGLEAKLRKDITKAGWQVVELKDAEQESMMGTSHHVLIKIEIPNNLVEKLNNLREETAKQHIASKERKARLNHG
jgi:hypothetical protein